MNKGDGWVISLSEVVAQLAKGDWRLVSGKSTSIINMSIVLIRSKRDRIVVNLGVQGEVGAPFGWQYHFYQVEPWRIELLHTQNLVDPELVFENPKLKLRICGK